MNNLKLYGLTIPQKAIYLAELYSSGSNLNSIGGNIIIEENVFVVGNFQKRVNQ